MDEFNSRKSTKEMDKFKKSKVSIIERARVCGRLTWSISSSPFQGVF